MYNFSATDKKIIDNESASSALEHFKTIIAESLNDAFGDARKAIEDEPGFFQKLATRGVQFTTRESASKVAESGTQAISGNANVARAVGIATNLALYLIFLYYNKTKKDALEAAKELVNNSKQWGNNNQPLIVKYLQDRFKFILVEMKQTKTGLDDIKNFADLCCVAVLDMLQKRPIVTITTLTYEHLDQFLFPINKKNTEFLFLTSIKEFIDETPALKKFYEWLFNANIHWNFSNIVYRAPVCTPKGGYYSLSGNQDREQKYPPQCLDYNVALKLGFESARINLQGNPLDEPEKKDFIPSHFLYDPDKSRETQLDEYKESFKSDLEDTLKEERWRKVLKVNGKEALWFAEQLRTDRAKLKKCLLAKSTDVSKRIEPYIKSLWQYSYNRYYLEDKIADHSEARWLKEEIRWLQKSIWVLNPANELELPNGRVKTTDTQRENIDKLFVWLARLEKYSAKKTEIGFGDFNQAESYDIKFTEKRLYERLTAWCSPRTVQEKLENAVKVYKKSLDDSDFSQAAINSLTEIINKLSLPENKNETNQKLLIQAYLLRALTHQAKESYDSALEDTAAILNLNPDNREALQLKATICVDFNLDNAADAVRAFHKKYPQDREANDLLDRYNDLRQQVASQDIKFSE